MKAHGLTPIRNVSNLDARFRRFETLGWDRARGYGDPPAFGAVRRCG